MNIDTTADELVSNQVPVFRVELVCERVWNGPVVASPEQVARVACEYLKRADREHFIVLLLATNCRLIGVNTAHVGSLAASVVRVADVFKAAILANAASVVFAHNHPSNNLEPSQEDLRVTRRLVEAGRLLDVPVLDHLITGHDGRYTSLAERGLLG